MSWNLPTHGPVHGYSVNQHLLDQAKASVHFILVAVIPQNRQRNLHVIMFKQSVLVCWLIVSKCNKKGNGASNLFNTNQITIKQLYSCRQ